MSGEAIAQAEPERKRGFSLPSAYTILFGLIVVAAIATWVIPAGVYDLNPAGESIPGTYHEIASSPAHILRDSLTAPINGLYGIEDAQGTSTTTTLGRCSARSTSRCSSSSSAGSSA
jgi:uncharacterized ion transporter superfamily protein YfcC